ncbi:MAG: lamin tail domain-containing protein [Candidatus Saccharimonadales bacterium]
MKLARSVLLVITGVFICCAPLSSTAFADTVPGLVFREVKITGDEFVVLQNNGLSDIAHLNDYWLGYVGSDTGTAPPSQQLPDVTLKSGQAILLSGGGTINTCDAVFVTKLSPSLSDTKGTLTIWKMAGGSFGQAFGQPTTVNWSKPSASGTTADALDLRSESGLANPVWYHDPSVDSSAWRAGSLDACTVTFPAVVSGSPVTSVNWPQNDTNPPATIESLAADDSGASGAVLPSADVGLLSPQITELMPNPDGTGNDATDEFIELYNPNGAIFDLTGFVLQTGTTTKHSYTFPGGTLLSAKGFVAFYAANTTLSLSNTSGQADLLDPFGTTISQTDAYASAKDGQTWALANGDWYWTTKPTPNAANVINQTINAVTSSSSKSTGTKLAAGNVKGASTPASNSANNTTGASSSTPQVTPIHPTVLAGVAALAVAYGLYEYRHDVANKLHQLRVYRDARRKARQ